MAIWFFFNLLKLKIEFIYFSGGSEKEECLKYAGGCKRSEENPWELVLSSDSVGPWDWTQVERCDGKYL